MSEQSEKALVLYMKNLPAEQAAIRSELTAIEPHRQFGRLVGRGQLDDAIALMLPTEVHEMTISSKQIFMDDEPVITSESFWRRILEQDAQDRIKAYHRYLRSKDKKTHTKGGQAILPPTMRDSGCGYAEVRDPVKVTAQLSSVLRAIMQSDRDDEWKLSCLFELGEPMIAGALRLNDQMDDMATLIFELLSRLINEHEGVTYRDRVLAYLCDMIDSEPTVDPTAPLDDEAAAQLKALERAQQFSEQIRYWLNCPWGELEALLGDEYLEHAAELASDEESFDAEAAGVEMDTTLAQLMQQDIPLHEEGETIEGEATEVRTSENKEQ